MDWGNAIVRSKEVDASGIVTSITMDLNLEGDFRKTKKKITWLAQPTAEAPGTRSRETGPRRISRQRSLSIFGLTNLSSVPDGRVLPHRINSSSGQI